MLHNFCFLVGGNYRLMIPGTGMMITIKYDIFTCGMIPNHENLRSILIFLFSFNQENVNLTAPGTHSFLL